MINDLFGAAPFDFTARWSNPSLIVNLIIFIVCKFVFSVSRKKRKEAHKEAPPLTPTNPLR